MTPKSFLRGGGAVLIVIGALGLTGLFGRISPLAFFHPPYWINWLHFLLGLAVFAASFSSDRKLQAGIVLFPAVVATALGVLGLAFGRYAAERFATPEFADPSDHIVHLIVGFCAIWAWRNRRVADRQAKQGRT